MAFRIPLRKITTGNCRSLSRRWVNTITSLSVFCCNDFLDSLTCGHVFPVSQIALIRNLNPRKPKPSRFAFTARFFCSLRCISKRASTRRDTSVAFSSVNGSRRAGRLASESVAGFARNTHSADLGGRLLGPFAA